MVSSLLNLRKRALTSPASPPPSPLALAPNSVRCPPYFFLLLTPKDALFSLY